MTPIPQTPEAILASRAFGENDQQAFARLTGDYNPIHIDPVSARRTQAGDVVVHGVHGVLWALDELARSGAIDGKVASLSVKFPKFVFLDRRVDLRLTKQSAHEITATIALGSLVTTVLILKLGDTSEADATIIDGQAQRLTNARPANWARTEDIAQLQGSLDVRSRAEDISRHFPHIAAKIGDDRVAAIALLSTIVGMQCPGLNSLFSSFAVRMAESPRARDGMRFRVTYTDNRFRIVRMSVGGAGISGEVQAFLKPEAVAQRAIGEVARSVSATEFAGSTALVVGGSRGLGALTAKIIAAGGGRVIVTYARGKEDALELAEEIRAHTGTRACAVVCYDALEDPLPQLGALDERISHLYYFATPVIGQQREAAFVPAMLEAFMAIYVTGFHNCCHYLASAADGPVTAFYPSTVFAENTPPTMIEYAMAKTAGEMLCAHINRSNIGVRTVLHRLPRLLTDQTATIPPVAARDPLEVMLPVIRQVQGAMTE